MSDQSPLDPTAGAGLPDAGAPTVPTPEAVPPGPPLPPADGPAWAAVPPTAATSLPPGRPAGTAGRRPWLIAAAVAGTAIVAGAAGYGLGSQNASDGHGHDRGAFGPAERDQDGQQVPPNGYSGGGYGPGGQTDPDGDNWQGQGQGQDRGQGQTQGQGQDQHGTFGGATPGSGGMGPRTQSGGS